jgi:hypothetical protein
MRGDALSGSLARMRIVIPAFGVTQTGILPGPHHWIVRVAHRLTGMVGMGLADALRKRALALTSVRGAAPRARVAA